MSPRSKKIVADNRQSKSQKGNSESERPIDYAKLYQEFGLDVPAGKKGEECVTCPECDKDKLYINLDNGLYDCKACGFKGNHLTLLRL